jgi:methionyl-tRNA formyltransferase
MPAMLRTVFMGTPELALPALRVLARRTRVELVVTQPDRAAGRGRRHCTPPVKLLARELGLPVWQPARLSPAAAARRLAVDLVVVLAYGHLLGDAALAAPRLGCINLHGSLLPRWRGASPLQAALLAGDAETGVSVMRMVRRLDAGPVCLRRSLALPPRADLPWLHEALAALAATALEEFLDRDPPPAAQPQDEAQVTVCGKLGHADGRLDWFRPVAELDRRIRAFVPVPGCWAASAGGELRILAAQPAPAAAPLPVAAVRAEHGHLLVGCGDGVLEILRLQAPGGRPLAARDYLNGHPPPDFGPLP